MRFFSFISSQSLVALILIGGMANFAPSVAQDALPAPDIFERAKRKCMQFVQNDFKTAGNVLGAAQKEIALHAKETLRVTGQDEEGKITQEIRTQALPEDRKLTLIVQHQNTLEAMTAAVPYLMGVCENNPWWIDAYLLDHSENGPTAQVPTHGPGPMASYAEQQSMMLAMEGCVDGGRVDITKLGTEVQYGAHGPMDVRLTLVSGGQEFPTFGGEDLQLFSAGDISEITEFPDVGAYYSKVEFCYENCDQTPIYRRVRQSNEGQNCITLSAGDYIGYDDYAGDCSATVEGPKGILLDIMAANPYSAQRCIPEVLGTEYFAGGSVVGLEPEEYLLLCETSNDPDYRDFQDLVVKVNAFCPIGDVTEVVLQDSIGPDSSSTDLNLALPATNDCVGEGYTPVPKDFYFDNVMAFYLNDIEETRDTSPQMSTSGGDGQHQAAQSANQYELIGCSNPNAGFASAAGVAFDTRQYLAGVTLTKASFVIAPTTIFYDTSAAQFGVQAIREEDFLLDPYGCSYEDPVDCASIVFEAGSGAVEVSEFGTYNHPVFGLLPTFLVSVNLNSATREGELVTNFVDLSLPNGEFIIKPLILSPGGVSGGFFLVTSDDTGENTDLHSSDGSALVYLTQAHGVDRFGLRLGGFEN